MNEETYTNKKMTNKKMKINEKDTNPEQEESEQRKTACEIARHRLESSENGQGRQIKRKIKSETTQTSQIIKLENGTSVNLIDISHNNQAMVTKNEKAMQVKQNRCSPKYLIAKCVPDYDRKNHSNENIPDSQYYVGPKHFTIYIEDVSNFTESDELSLKSTRDISETNSAPTQQDLQRMIEFNQNTNRETILDSDRKYPKFEPIMRMASSLDLDSSYQDDTDYYTISDESTFNLETHLKHKIKILERKLAKKPIINLNGREDFHNTEFSLSEHFSSMSDISDERLIRREWPIARNFAYLNILNYRNAISIPDTVKKTIESKFVTFDAPNMNIQTNDNQTKNFNQKYIPMYYEIEDYLYHLTFPLFKTICEPTIPKHFNSALAQQPDRYESKFVTRELNDQPRKHSENYGKEENIKPSLWPNQKFASTQSEIRVNKEKSVQTFEENRAFEKTLNFGEKDKFSLFATDSRREFELDQCVTHKNIQIRNFHDFNNKVESGENKKLNNLVYCPDPESKKAIKISESNQKTPNIQFDGIIKNNSLGQRISVREGSKIEKKINGGKNINSNHKLSTHDLDCPLSSKKKPLPEKVQRFDLSEMNIKIIREIGIGATSKVYEGLFQGKRIAIKRILRKNKKTFYTGINEVAVLKKVSHPYIIELLDVIEREEDLIMVFDLYEKGPILFRQNLSENKIAKILRMICIAVDYLHYNGIMHRDLKLDNILVLEKKVKICDFGLATNVGKHTTICGTKHCMAPEIGSTYDEKIDIFNIGVIAYHLIIGSWTEHTNSFNIEILECSDIMRDFLSLALTRDPSRRPSATDLLRHPLFDIFLPKMENHDKCPDFEHKTSIGTLVKKGNMLKLGPLRIENSYFFLHKTKLPVFKILHEHLRIVHLMQKIVRLYIDKHRKILDNIHLRIGNERRAHLEAIQSTTNHFDTHMHQYAGYSNQNTESSDQKSVHSRNTQINNTFTSSSYILPTIRYMPYKDYWLIFNPAHNNQFDILVDQKRVSVNREKIQFSNSYRSDHYEIDNLIKGRPKLDDSNLQLLIKALETTEYFQKKYKK